MTTLAYQAPTKRPAAVAALDGKTIRPVKRRASKACQCCRSRKVRCNVIEHGAPCTNCRLDEVPCIVTESKRKRKSAAVNSHTEDANGVVSRDQAGPTFFVKNDDSYSNGALGTSPQSGNTFPNQSAEHHVPHTLYAKHAPVPAAPGTTNLSMVANGNPPYPQNIFTPPAPPAAPTTTRIPYYLYPLPARIGQDELAFLTKKNALSVPSTELRNELLRCYVEFVHPFMPILQIEEFLRIVNQGDGSLGRISLLLFQAVMFAASAMVDTSHLKKAGFASRKEARKAFYVKARLLYDFDYEVDRVALLQSLLLMTSWYESPDDQKDTWHWMGNAISLAHTIGLNRDPTHTSMEPAKQKQWRRMWWTCIVRDRLIALGMRRPTRIKPEDHNVPMLTLDDFELSPIPSDIACIPASCTCVRDEGAMRAFALMCIEKAKLCLIISHVLTAQYSLPEQPSSESAEGAGQTSNLVPKSTNKAEVDSCNAELNSWVSNLPPEATLEMPPVVSRDRGDAPVTLNRAVLHMVYYTTLSALHRPQVLTESRFNAGPADTMANAARDRVRNAADSITSIACSLLEADLVRFLPTTGVTVLQPAIISHLLDIKAVSEELQTSGLQGFCQCVQVMSRMRSVYAAADYSLALIEAAVRKADINIPSASSSSAGDAMEGTSPAPKKASGTEDLIDAGLRRKLVRPVPDPRTITPPPDGTAAASRSHLKAGRNSGVEGNLSIPTPRPSTAAPSPSSPSDSDVARRLGLFLASTPPQDFPGLSATSPYPDTTSGGFLDPTQTNSSIFARGMGLQATPMPDLDREFESLINLDDFGDAYSFNAGGLTSLQGESSGFTFDMDWLRESAMIGGSISRPKSGMSLFGNMLERIEEGSEMDESEEEDDEDEEEQSGDVKIPV